MYFIASKLEYIIIELLCTLVASDTNSLSQRGGKGGALMNLNILSAWKYGIFDSSAW